jgi:hypothetical protein
MSRLRWLFALLLLAVLALMVPMGCGPAPGEDEESATSGALALSASVAAFQISGLPAFQSAGVPATMTVRAVDASGNTVTDYAGPAVVTSSDLAALLPAAPVFSGGVAKGVSITFVTPGAQTVTVADAGSPSVKGTASTTVLSSGSTTVTAPASATAGTSGLTASTPQWGGATYTWTIRNGTITAGQGTRTITFKAGSAGTLTLGVIAARGGSVRTGSTSVNIVAAPQTPAITAPASVAPLSTGNTATVAAAAGMTYTWTVSQATITSPGGTSGVTSGGLNGITFTVGSTGPVLLSVVERNSLGAQSASGTATIAVTAVTPATGEIYFVAHQDDDLLFMNPDIERSILAGKRTQAVFVTAGDDGSCTPCWQGRENGIWNAYAAMANVAKDWTCAPRTFHGKTVSSCVLNTAPHVSVVFMRLPDGGLASLWATDSGPPFWVTPVPSLTSVDGAYTVTKAEAITLVYDVIADFHPAVVGTMDSTLAYGDDHPDHQTSALLALEASFRVDSPLTLRIFRAYNIYGNYFTIPSPEPENLSPAEYAEKVRIMEAYAGGFPVDSDFDRWCHRRYAISRLAGGAGPLVEPGGKCLDTQNGASTSGAPIVVRPCDGSASQLWTVGTGGQLTRAAGKCLSLGAGGAGVLADCSADLAQRFRLFQNGQIRGQGGTCLTIGADGVTVSAALCDADRTTDKYVPLPTQRFTQRFGLASRWSAGTDFSDADLGASASYYGTLRLGRIDGDRRADAFVRRAGGVASAMDQNPGFGALATSAGLFSDAAGWLPAQYGTTVQLADVSGDGLADVCGRNAAGIACAVAAPGGGFGPVAQWSNDFGDATFGGDAYYPSVRFGDINGDGYADVCGRASGGIVCALNSKAGAFAPATSWLADFTDAAGWGVASSTRTLRLADVNGDGKADVCLRGSAGVRCAISSGSSAFTDAHLWSFRAEWSDAEGWGASAGRYASLDLADVNGDGKADLCGRAATGLVCAISNGAGFETAAPVLPTQFTDALGWSSEQYGASLRLGDLNADGRADVCGRDSAGLLCAIAP